jgi:hypothetical protein
MYRELTRDGTHVNERCEAQPDCSLENVNKWQIAEHQ